MRVAGAEDHRGEGGVPVVRVDDVRAELEMGAEIERRGREEGEPLAVVRVGGAVIVIEAGPLEIPVALEETDEEARELELIDLVGDACRIGRGREDERPDYPGLQCRVDARVVGHHDARGVPLARELLGERLRDVRESAGLRYAGEL